MQHRSIISQNDCNTLFRSEHNSVMSSSTFDCQHSNERDTLNRGVNLYKGGISAFLAARKTGDYNSYATDAAASTREVSL